MYAEAADREGNKGNVMKDAILCTCTVSASASRQNVRTYAYGVCDVAHEAAATTCPHTARILY